MISLCALLNENPVQELRRFNFYDFKGFNFEQPVVKVSPPQTAIKEKVRRLTREKDRALLDEYNKGYLG